VQFVFPLVLLLMFLLILPLAMRNTLQRWKVRRGVSLRGRSEMVDWRRVGASGTALYWTFELFLALAVFCTFLASMAAWLSFDYVFSKTVLEIDIGNFDLDKPLTGRGFLYLSGLFFCPWVVFHYVGAVSIRDVHQLCKEVRDIVVVSGEKQSSVRSAGLRISKKRQKNALFRK